MEYLPFEGSTEVNGFEAAQGPIRVYLPDLAVLQDAAESQPRIDAVDSANLQAAIKMETCLEHARGS